MKLNSHFEITLDMNNLNTGENTSQKEKISTNSKVWKRKSYSLKDVE